MAKKRLSVGPSKAMRMKIVGDEPYPTKELQKANRERSKDTKSSLHTRRYDIFLPKKGSARSVPDGKRWNDIWRHVEPSAEPTTAQRKKKK